MYLVVGAAHVFIIRTAQVCCQLGEEGWSWFMKAQTYTWGAGRCYSCHCYDTCVNRASASSKSPAWCDNRWDCVEAEHKPLKHE